MGETVEGLLNELERGGIHVWEEEGNLRYRAPRGAMTAARRQRLQQHKQEVLSLLRRDEEDPPLVPDPVSRYEPFPLTDVQEAYLLGRTSAYAYGSSACAVYVEVSFDDLEVEAVEAAWNRLIERHDMLRAVVHPDGHQRVLPEVDRYEVAGLDLRAASAEDVQAALASVRADMDHRAYRPDTWPLFEVRLTRAATSTLLHLSVDFLIADYLSIQVLLREFAALRTDPHAALPTLDIRLRDYLLASRQRTGGRASRRDREYWLARIDDLPAAPDLPVVPSAGDSGTARFRRWQTHVAPADWEGLRRAASAENVTPSAAVLAAYAEVLARWSRKPAFTINLTLLNREPLHPHVPHLVGDFTSVSLLAVRHRPDEPFAARARALLEQLWADMDHRRFSGVEMIREVARRRGQMDALMPVVFTSTIGLADGQGDQKRSGRLVHSISQTPQLWIDCQAVEDAGGLTVSWDVRDGVFPDGLVEDMFTALAALLRNLSRSGPAWRSASPVPLPEEQSRRRAEVNDTAAPVPKALLHGEVVRQAQRTPERPAVISSTGDLTYGELLTRASGVTRTLVDRGVEPRARVAVVMDQGWEQVAAVVGALMAGAVYVPVDTNQPPARRARMLADAGARVVLTQSWLESQSWPEGVLRVAVDRVADAAEPTSRGDIGPADIAYVIYTSGSTGSPKGVAITHEGAANTLADVSARFGVTGDDRVLGLANLGFDLSVYDVFGVLGLGGVLVLPDPARRGDPSHWADLIAGHGVTLWNSVPAQLRMLQDYLGTAPEVELPSLRLAFLSGDWIPVTLPDEMRRRLPGLRLVSMGGATEASIWSIYHEIGEVPESWASIPYGKPLANQRFHVLDESMAPCPDWCPGELYIAGAGLATGYLGDEARTAERFVIHPQTRERLYRTGDLGRYWPDGTIEFLGREDRQIKIRGHRIELAEVEAALQSHPDVAMASVAVPGDTPMERRIAAFVEPVSRPRDPDRARREAEAVVAAAREAGDAVLAGVDTERFVRFVLDLDEVAQLAMVRALCQQGLFASPEDRHTLEEILTATGAAERHHALLSRWLTALEAEGVLLRDEPTRGYRRARAVDATVIEEVWARLPETELDMDDYGPELVDYFRLSTEQLPELIRDEVGALQLLFPNGDTAISETAYRNNLISRYTNTVLATSVRAIASLEDGPLRVLEVGAGVGGASAELIPALDGFEVDYLYTDVSPFFLNEARERFSAYPWVRYGLYDINEGYRSQGLLPNTFDIVVSNHVLHYARHVEQALQRTSELLVPGGWILFCDLTRDNYQIMTSMMFLGGLTSFDDFRGDSNKTFVSRQEWLDVLGKVGAETVLCLPEADEVFAAVGQHVIAARVKTDRAAVDVSDLGTHLAERLPESMLPGHLQVVDALPLTENGKVDSRVLRSWLPQESAGHVVAPGGEPEGELEERIAALWADVLGIDRVGRDQDFFELGGDSLLAARLVGRMREEIAEASDVFWEGLVRTFLPEPTVARLAEQLSGAGGGLPAGVDSALLHVSPRAGADGGVPLVLVPDGSGTVVAYDALARSLDGHRTVLAAEVASREQYLALPPEDLVEHLAAAATSELRDAGCERVDLVGFHLGGLTATAIARQVRERGGEVGRLAVVSSFPVPCRVGDALAEYLFLLGCDVDPTALGFPDEACMGDALAAIRGHSPDEVGDEALAALDDSPSHCRAARRFRRLLERPRDDRLARIGEAVVERGGAAGLVGPEDVIERCEVFRHGLAAGCAHPAEPYAGDVTLLVHRDERPIWPTLREDMVEYWRGVCLGELQVLDIGGDHFHCLSAPHLEAVRAVVVGHDVGREAR